MSLSESKQIALRIIEALDRDGEKIRECKIGVDSCEYNARKANYLARGMTRFGSFINFFRRKPARPIIPEPLDNSFKVPEFDGPLTLQQSNELKYLAAVIGDKLDKQISAVGDIDPDTIKLRKSN